MKKIMILSFALLFIIACGSSENEEKAHSDIVSITTEMVPDAQTGKPYEAKIDINGGSGEYILDAELPLGLSLTSDGTINGTTYLEPASYSFIVNVIDKNFNNNKFSKEFILNVVAYLPDQYEPDNDFPVESGNVITPDSGSQLHTIHETGDIDFYSVDLSSVNESDLIIFKGVFSGGNLVLRLYNSEMEPIEIAINDVNPNETIIRYSITKPDKYYVSVNNQTLCEYNFEVKNANTPISLIPESLPYAESLYPYSHVIKAQGNGDREKIFSIYSGILPGGLQLDSITGQIKGMNNINGTFSFSVKVCDSENSENFDIEEYSIAAYIGQKVIAQDKEEYLSWKMNKPPKPYIGTHIFKTTVQSSHGIRFEEINLPDVLSVWKNSTFATINPGTRDIMWVNKYKFSPENGDVSVIFHCGASTEPYDRALVHDSNRNFYKHTLTYKVYDVLYPENFDYFTYTVNMQITGHIQ